MTGGVLLDKTTALLSFSRSANTQTFTRARARVHTYTQTHQHTCLHVRHNTHELRSESGDTQRKSFDLLIYADSPAKPSNAKRGREAGKQRREIFPISKFHARTSRIEPSCPRSFPVPTAAASPCPTPACPRRV